MKSIFDEINKLYVKNFENFNNSKSFCHSMNIEDYKIVYKDFFADNKNVFLEQKIALEDDFASEDVFVDWLKRE